MLEDYRAQRNFRAMTQPNNAFVPTTGNGRVSSAKEVDTIWLAPQTGLSADKVQGNPMQSKSRKLTPTAIARPKISLNVPDHSYNHETQTVHGDSLVIFATTWNATQTFDSNGRPKDKDNDK